MSSAIIERQRYATGNKQYSYTLAFGSLDYGYDPDGSQPRKRTSDMFGCPFPLGEGSPLIVVAMMFYWCFTR